MKKYVADTHALFWYLTGSKRLGVNAKSAFDEALKGKAIIYVPSIVLAELYFLNEKLGLPLNFASIMKILRDSSQFTLVPFRALDILDFDKDRIIPEMHDRMIVGVARRKRAACLTIDPKIVASGLVKIVW